MNKIKFSHNYEKLKHIDIKKPIILLQMFKLNVIYLSDYFLDYDTIYYKNNRQMNYPLKNDMEVIILLFMQNFNLFTTIRRFTIEKFNYYKSKIGYSFKIELSKYE